MPKGTYVLGAKFVSKIVSMCGSACITSSDTHESTSIVPQGLRFTNYRN